MLLKAEELITTELSQSLIELVDRKARILSEFGLFTESKSVSDIRFQSRNDSVRLPALDRNGFRIEGWLDVAERIQFRDGNERPFWASNN